jgi:hypothetical protein
VEVAKKKLDHKLARNPRIRLVSGIPREERYTEITMESIRHYFGELSNSISGVSSHFVFNVDEMGHQEWVSPV